MSMSRFAGSSLLKVGLNIAVKQLRTSVYFNGAGLKSPGAVLDHRIVPGCCQRLCIFETANVCARCQSQHCSAGRTELDFETGALHDYALSYRHCRGQDVRVPNGEFT